MTWTVDYNSTLGLIDLVFVSNITGPDAQEATSKGIALSKEQGITNFLVDVTDMELTPSIFDLYDLPTKQYLEEGLDHRSHIAVVLPIRPKAKEATQFYETVCVNHGWRVQSFPNRDEAIEWLTGTDYSNKPDPGEG